MKKLSIVLLSLVLIFTTACGGGGNSEVSEVSENLIESSVQETESAIEEIPEPESSEPEESSQPESSEEESEQPEESDSIKVAQPDTTPKNTKPIREVEAITDEYALSMLGKPIEDFDKLDNTSVVWGPGITSGEARPSEPVRLQNLYGGYGAYFIGPEGKNIYLSFDEGYETGYTAPILDVLKENNVKAVFFVTLGYVKSCPDLVQRMIDEGHIVGNHSSSHPVGGMPTMGSMDMAKDILYLHEYVKQNFGYEMTLFRPPEGTFSQRSLAVMQALGYKSIFWSFAYRDWEVDNQPDTATAMETIMNRSHPGAIYLLHAVSSTNATVLDQAIKDLQSKKGYTFSDWSNLA